MKLFLFLTLLLLNLLFGYFQYAKSRSDETAGKELALLEINPDKVILLKNGMRHARSGCLSWGSFSQDDVGRAVTALDALKLDGKFVQRDTDPGYWVYVPPLGSKADANRKGEELKGRGITDFYIVQEAGAWQFAISLGVFNTEQAAANYLAQLKKKNVRSAVIGPRGTKTSTFIIQNADETASAQLTALKSDFPSALLKATPCPAPTSEILAPAND